MLLLALDTTTAAGSVALWRDGLIEERSGDAARSHAQRLPADLVALLAAHGLAPRDVERYAVAAGPGAPGAHACALGWGRDASAVECSVDSITGP